MGTIKEGEYELDRRCSSSNSVNRTRTRTWKKKRPSRLNETEVYIFTSMYIYVHANAYVYHGIYIRTYFERKQNVYHVCTFRAIVFGYSSNARKLGVHFNDQNFSILYVVLTCKSSAINKIFAPTYSVTQIITLVEQCESYTVKCVKHSAIRIHRFTLCSH